MSRHAARSRCPPIRRAALSAPARHLNRARALLHRLDLLPPPHVPVQRVVDVLCPRLLALRQQRVELPQQPDLGRVVPGLSDQVILADL